MRHALMRLVSAWLLLALVAAALPAPAAADARDYPGLLGAAHRSGGRSGFVNGGRAHPFGRHRYHHRHRQATGWVFPGVALGTSFVYAAPPPVVYAPPPPVYYVPAPAYAAPPAYYAPPPEPVAPPPSPPEPRVVEFDSGRYELRGDGVREPHVWVWVPKPPKAPPGEPPPPRRRATIYRWTDPNGVTTLTDDPTKVPPHFRATEIIVHP